MFEFYPLWTNFTAFAAAAVVVWIAGSRLAGYAEEIAQATGIRREILGIILLGGVTSLPEMAVAVTASVAGHPELSINDLLGSAAINVVIIAIADAVFGRDAITSVLASPAVMLQGVLGIVLLAMVSAATMTLDVPFLGASAWTWTILLTYFASVAIIAKSNSQRAWIPMGAPAPAMVQTQRHNGRLSRSLAISVGVAGMAILCAGFILAKTAEAIAVQTDLGTNFVGAILLAASTSLPEVSTVVAAVRLKRYEMAISGVFGTNLFNVTIIFAVDALYDGGPVLGEVGDFAGVGAILAIILTALYLVGMIERRNRTILRMGFDSLAALVVYGAGVAILYQLR